jgi:hypothetical protein
MNTLTINTNADRALLKRSGLITGAGYIQLTKSDVVSGQVMAWLAARTGRSVTGLAGAVWSSKLDSRRLFTGAQRERIIARDGGCCAYCGKATHEGDRYIDHVIPHTAGGQTVDANGVLACGDCNLAKSNRWW